MRKEERRTQSFLFAFCATSWKVAGSIPDGVIGIFHSDRTMVLELTQTVTEMAPRNISWWVKVAGE